jgi:hypothetical protein
MNKLDSAVILRLLREERSKQLDALRQEINSQGLSENINVNVNVGGVTKKVISPGLKLRSKAGKLYTVKAISPTSAVLIDPNGQSTVVTDMELESGFDLD